MHNYIMCNFALCSQWWKMRITQQYHWMEWMAATLFLLPFSCFATGELTACTPVCTFRGLTKMARRTNLFFCRKKTLIVRSFMIYANQKTKKIIHVKYFFK